MGPDTDPVRSARLVLPSSPPSVRQSPDQTRPVPARANPVPETKWGLGLEHIQDLPLEDIYNFGLVSRLSIPLDHRNHCYFTRLTNIRSSNTWAPHCQYSATFRRSGARVGKRANKANILFTATSQAFSALSLLSSSRTFASSPPASTVTPSSPSSRSASCFTSPSCSSRSTFASPPASNGIPPSSGALACPAYPSTPRWRPSVRPFELFMPPFSCLGSRREDHCSRTAPGLLPSLPKQGIIH